MSIFRGGSEITDLYVGSTPVTEVYRGATLIWAAVSISNQNISDVAISPANAKAEYEIDPDKFVYSDVSSGRSQLEQWTKGTPGDYEARVTIASGSLDTGTAGVWLSCAGLLQWGNLRAANGTNTCTFDVEIRRASNQVVLASARIITTATREP